jgi:hypothetical protein
LTAAPSSQRASSFALATPADDIELRALMRRTPIEGAVSVAFTREPDYFAGEGLAGADDRTWVHRDGEQIDGLGRLSVSRLHRNGTVFRIGYLAELRADPQAQARGAAARHLRDGYALVREVVLANAVDGCFTSIAADNFRARRVLEYGGRLGIPTYTPIAELVTMVIPVGRPPRNAKAPGGVAEDRDELTDFLERHAVRSQLSPLWSDALWTSLGRHGLGAGDFHVVREHGRIVAAGAVWDQRAFRQVVVRGYAGALNWARPVVNALARFGVAPPLPPPGTVLPQGAILGGAVDEPRHWAPLLDALRAAASERALTWLLIGRDARDPELSALRRLRIAREYHTRLYDVRWPDVPSYAGAWNELPFRPEVAFL